MCEDLGLHGDDGPTICQNQLILSANPVSRIGLPLAPLLHEALCDLKND